MDEKTDLRLAVNRAFDGYTAAVGDPRSQRNFVADALADAGFTRTTPAQGERAPSSPPPSTELSVDAREDTQSGLLCFVGTRIPLAAVLTFMRAGHAPGAIRAEYPTLTVAQIEACAALATGETTGGWRAITEAPSHQSVILHIQHPKGLSMVVCGWKPDVERYGWWMIQGHSVPIDGTHPEDSLTDSTRALHWMSLPAPPETAGVGAVK